MADSNNKQLSSSRGKSPTARSGAGRASAGCSTRTKSSSGSNTSGKGSSGSRSSSTASKSGTSKSGTSKSSTSGKREVTRTVLNSSGDKKRASVQPARAGRRSASDEANEKIRTSRSYSSNANMMEEEPVNKTMVDEIVVIVSLVIALLMVLSLFDVVGVVGQGINFVTFGLFGKLAYALPFLLVIFTMFFAINDGLFVSRLRIICSVVLFINLSALIHMIGYGFDKEISIWKYFPNSAIDYAEADATGAGFLGGLIVKPLNILLDKVGTMIIIIAVILAMLVVITRKAFILYYSKKLSSSAKQKYEEYRISRREQKLYGRYGSEDEAEDEYPEHCGSDFSQKAVKSSRQDDSERRMGTFVVSHGKNRKNKQEELPAADVSDIETGYNEYGDESNFRLGSAENEQAGNRYNDDWSQGSKENTSVDDYYENVTDIRNSQPASDNFADEELERKFSGASDNLPEVGRRESGKHGLTETIMLSDEVYQAPDRIRSLHAGSNADIFNTPEDGEYEFNAKDFEEAEKDNTRNAELEGITHTKSSNVTHNNVTFIGQEKDSFSDKNDKPNNSDEVKNTESEIYGNTALFGSEASLSESSHKTDDEEALNSQRDDVHTEESSDENEKAASVDKPKTISSGSRYTVTQRKTGRENIDPVRDTSGSVRFTDMNAEPEKTLEKVVPEYIFPPVDFLKKGKAGNGNSMAASRELEETKVMLKRTFESFGVGVTVTDASVGPTVTRYEILPDQGVKVKNITALSDDIALALAATEIRFEAPIPGKAAVGIEVPNKESSPVFFGDLIDSDDFKKAKSKLTIAIGKDIGGKLILSDIAGMPHALIAGSTGSGKSVCINALIMSILYKAKPSEVKMIMVDPKRVELVGYNGIPHLLVPVVTDVKKATGALNWAIAEMDNRYQLFADAMVNNLASYNEQLQQEYEAEGNTGDCPKKLPQIVIIIDELNDLMMTGNAKEVEGAICRLTQLARACGIHVILATQRPSVNVITGTIKANIPTRMAFAVSSLVDSRTIIDQAGAEKLIGKGDMLFYPQGYPKPVRLQGAFVSDSEVKKVVDFIKENSRKVEYSEVVKQHLENFEEAKSGNSAAPAEGGAPEKRDDRDEFFEQSGMAIIEKQKASIGMLQRLFRIGFNRSARIMDQLCEAGVVGPEEGTKPRKILMTKQQFEEYLEGSYTEE